MPNTGWEDWEAAASGHRDSMMSLQELEPSPIESPWDEEAGEFPGLEPDLKGAVVEGHGAGVAKGEAKPELIKRTSTLGLSGSGHGAVYYLTRIQRYSSYAFGIFTTFHITNTSLIPLITRSVPKSDNALLLTRPYYQSFPLEPLLITIPLIAHITSGLALRLYRRNVALTKYGASTLTPSARLKAHVQTWPNVSNISKSGFILVPLVTGHAFVNRFLPWYVDGGSSSVGLGFVAHGSAKHPAVANLGYAALVVVFSGHLVWGAARWQGWSQIAGLQTKAGKRRWWVINGIVAAVAGVWMAGGLGVVGRGGLGSGWLAQLWDDIYARIPLLGL